MMPDVFTTASGLRVELPEGDRAYLAALHAAAVEEAAERSGTISNELAAVVLLVAALDLSRRARATADLHDLLSVDGFDLARCESIIVRAGMGPYAWTRLQRIAGEARFARERGDD